MVVYTLLRDKFHTTQHILSISAIALLHFYLHSDRLVAFYNIKDVLTVYIFTKQTSVRFYRKCFDVARNLGISICCFIYTGGRKLLHNLFYIPRVP